MSINLFDEEYIRVAKKCLSEGFPKVNDRTGKFCHTIHGEAMLFDLSKGYFPLLTIKKTLIRPILGELVGFLRGCSSAAEFRALGCNLWNQNANESIDWLNNPNRKGEDDLGRIYGVQARSWRSSTGIVVDQLANVVRHIKQKVDNRRLVVTHWNPGELTEMSLPPCHMFYQFHIREGYLDLSFYQRSCDLPLGVPFNIASYAALLCLIASMCNLTPGKLSHFMGDVHIYEDQMETFSELINDRAKYPIYSPPQYFINAAILNNLNDIKLDSLEVVNYQSGPFVKMAFSA